MGTFHVGFIPLVLWPRITQEIEITVCSFSVMANAFSSPHRAITKGIVDVKYLLSSHCRDMNVELDDVPFVPRAWEAEKLPS